MTYYTAKNNIFCAYAVFESPSCTNKPVENYIAPQHFTRQANVWSIYITPVGNVKAIFNCARIKLTRASQVLGIHYTKNKMCQYYFNKNLIV